MTEHAPRRRACAAAVAALALVAGAAARAGEPSPSRCATAGELRLALDEDAPGDDRFATLRGRSFLRTPVDVERFRLRLELADCAGEPPRWHPVIRLSSANSPIQPTNDDGSDIEAIRSVLGSSDLGHVTVAQVTQAIKRSGADADPRAVAFVFHYLGGADRDATLATAQSELSMAQKVAAAQYFGYLAEQRYDDSKAGSIKRKVITPAEVTAAAAAELAGRHPDLLAGDCSDVANAQAELLQKLGAKDVMVITTAHVVGLHTTVVARDPNDQTYWQLNYGSISRSSRREGADLLHVPGDDSAWIDVGPGIYIHRPNDRTLAYVPTNAGKLYAEVAGFDVHELEPLARATSSLLGAQLVLGHATSMQTYVARDPSGSYYAGMALTQSWAQRGHFPGTVGLVTGWRWAAPGMNVADVYVELEQRAVTPELHLGRFVRARADGALILVGTYAVPFADAADNAQGADAALMWNHGVELDVGAPGARFGGRFRVDAQLMPGVTNIAGSTPTVFLNHVVFGVDGGARLGHTRLGELRLLAGTAVLLDNFGPRVATGVGVETARLGVRLEANGRVLDSDPTYKEGALRRGRLLVGVTVWHGLRLSTSAEVQEGATDAKWTLTGAFDGRF